MDNLVIKQTLEDYKDVVFVISGVFVKCFDINLVKELDHNIFEIYFDNGFSRLIVKGASVDAILTGATIE